MANIPIRPKSCTGMVTKSPPTNKLTIMSPSELGSITFAQILVQCLTLTLSVPGSASVLGASDAAFEGCSELSWNRSSSSLGTWVTGVDSVLACWLFLTVSKTSVGSDATTRSADSAGYRLCGRSERRRGLEMPLEAYLHTRRTKGNPSADVASSMAQTAREAHPTNYARHCFHPRSWIAMSSHHRFHCKSSKRQGDAIYPDWPFIATGVAWLLVPKSSKAR